MNLLVKKEEKEGEQMRDLMTYQVTLCDNSHFDVYHEKQHYNGYQEHGKKMTKKSRSLIKLFPRSFFLQSCLSAQLGDMP